MEVYAKIEQTGQGYRNACGFVAEGTSAPFTYFAAVINPIDRHGAFGLGYTPYEAVLNGISTLIKQEGFGFTELRSEAE